MALLGLEQAQHAISLPPEVLLPSLALGRVHISLAPDVALAHFLQRLVVLKLPQHVGWLPSMPRRACFVHQIGRKRVRLVVAMHHLGPCQALAMVAALGAALEICLWLTTLSWRLRHAFGC